MSNSNSATTQPLIKTKKSISVIWILPIVALVISGWMLYHNWAHQGQLVTISFATADGIEAKKTKIRVRNVEVGKVESIELNYPDNNVLVKARIQPNAEKMLTANTLFWVVRPRIETGEISGLDTLFSGAYIEMSPGNTGESLQQYAGLEAPPVTSATEPGLRLKLSSKGGKSLSVGDKVFYRGFVVGRVEQVRFDTQKKEAVYSLFIQAPYNELVRSNTRFWNISGVSVNLSANGIELQGGTLDTLLMGGVSFDILKEDQSDTAAKNGQEFKLYPSFSAVMDQPFTWYNSYMLLFDQSVRGLVNGAPVEFRGVRIGTVENIAFRVSQTELDPRIPVLIHIEPGRLGLADAKTSLQDMHAILQQWVDKGMRASLKLGNIVTGSVFVDLDFYQSPVAAAMTKYGEYELIPSISGSFAQIETKLIAVLDKINKLEIEPLMIQANKALATGEHSLQQIDNLLRTKEIQALPQSLNTTLREIQKAAHSLSPKGTLYAEINKSLQTLQQTLKQMSPILDTLKNKPNALIFNAETPTDPIPGGRQ